MFSRGDEFTPFLGLVSERWLRDLAIMRRVLSEFQRKTSQFSAQWRV